MTLPFSLPDRPEVTKVRQRGEADQVIPQGSRNQPMRGYDEQYVDIVDYIVGITDEIWYERAIGRVYDTYDHACVIYSSYGVVRSVEEVIASTVAGINSFPDGEIHHLNVAWSGDEEEGFYTSHLGFSRCTNVGPTAWGPATGRRLAARFAADCISRDNKIHTEWLVRDAGAQVRQLGFNIQEVAQRVAERSSFDQFVIDPETRLTGQVPRKKLDIPNDTVDGWARHLFHNLWNLKRLDWLNQYYSSNAVVHGGGGRVAQGVRNIGALLIHVQTAIPDGVMRVEHVSHSEETDGVIVAVRWVYEGTTQRLSLIHI